MASGMFDLDAPEIVSRGGRFESNTEAQVHGLVQAQYDLLREQHVEWWVAFDEGPSPNSIAYRTELLELALAAPTPFAFGLIFGKIDLLDEMSRDIGSGVEFRPGVEFR